MYLRLGGFAPDGEPEVRDHSSEPSFVILLKYDVIELDVAVSQVFADMQVLQSRANLPKQLHFLQDGEFVLFDVGEKRPEWRPLQQQNISLAVKKPELA